MIQIDTSVRETSNKISVPDLEISQQDLADHKVSPLNGKGIACSESSYKSNYIDPIFSELSSI